MKKLLLVLLPLLLITNQVGNRANAHAIETTLKDQVLYAEDFESYAVNTTSDEIYNSKKLMWFESGNLTASVKDYKEGKALNYVINSSCEYAPLGGIGTSAINNLAKIQLGVVYTLSLRIDLLDVPLNSYLFIEVQDNVNGWTGVKIQGDNTPIILSEGNTFNVSYEDNLLEFSFHGGRVSNQENSWVKLTTQNYEVGSQFILDDFAITEKVSNRSLLNFSQDFESLAVGAKAEANNLSDIPNVYSTFNDLEIKEKDNNHYLEGNVTNSNKTDMWSKCYFNNLTMLTSDVDYRISFDFLDFNFSEFYICYNEGGRPCVTYSTTGYLSTDPSSYLIGGTFDGQHLTFEFKPSTSAGFGQFWNQVALVFKHNDDLHFEIDNLLIENLGFASDHIEVNTNGMSLKYLTGDKLDFSDLSVKLYRKNGDERVLASDEYIVDTSAVNMHQEGSYEVKIIVVDETGNIFEESLQIQVENDPFVGLQIIQRPNKLKYLLGEELDLTGLKVKALYQSGREIDLDISELSVEGFDSSTLGKKVLTVTYEGLQDMFTVTVIEKAEVSFQNIQTQVSLSFNYQETLNKTTGVKSYNDFKDISLTFKYEFDTTEFIDIDEIGLFICEESFEIESVEALPEGYKIVNETKTKEFTFTIENITDYEKEYYAAAYIKSGNSYKFARVIAYSVHSLLELYRSNTSSNYYEIVDSFYKSL